MLREAKILAQNRTEDCEMRYKVLIESVTGLDNTEQDDDAIIQNALVLIERLRYIKEGLEELKDASNFLSESEHHLDHILIEMDSDLDEIIKEWDDSENVFLEAVDRQFRRYGDRFYRQYRCTSGQKAGRIVTSPEKCGLRKDPKRVRLGKRAARSKKGSRIRKTQFTKRKSQSKRLTRLNTVLRGDK